MPASWISPRPQRARHIATICAAPSLSTAFNPPSWRPICRVSWSRCILRTICSSIISRRLKCTAIRKRARAWAVKQMELVAKASKNLGLKNVAAFPGALAWPYLYPWPQRPPGLIEAAFDELAKRWKPILDIFEANGQNCCFEVHPGEDIFDGETLEMFLERVNGHPACQILFDPSHFVLQQLDYLGYIDTYRDRIKMFHVKDAEFRPTAKQGVYGGYQSWVNRAGRFRSLGDGQVDFNGIFSKMAANNFEGWAVLEWECALKHPEDGAREGAQFIKKHIIRVTEKAFDDFAAGGDTSVALRTLGLK
jgi:sugar phosphate isomerase/epimerase